MAGKNTQWTGVKEAQRMYPLDKCAVCGRTKTLQRHHRNGDKNDNRKENVVVLCQIHHTLEHMKVKTWGKGRTLNDKVCPVCNEIFRPRKARQVLCGKTQCLSEWSRQAAHKRWSRESQRASRTALTA